MFQSNGRYSSMFNIGKDIVKREHSVPLKSIEKFYLNNLREYFEKYLAGVSAWNSGDQVTYNTVSSLCAFPSIGSLQKIKIEESYTKKYNPVSTLHFIVDYISDVSQMKPVKQESREALSEIFDYFYKIHEKAESSEDIQSDIIDNFDD